jgi:hypothetical protein
VHGCIGKGWLGFRVPVLTNLEGIGFKRKELSISLSSSGITTLMLIQEN